MLTMAYRTRLPLNCHLNSLWSTHNELFEALGQLTSPNITFGVMSGESYEPLDGTITGKCITDLMQVRTPVMITCNALWCAFTDIYISLTELVRGTEAQYFAIPLTTSLYLESFTLRWVIIFILHQWD
jgi:hypothetical protein